MNLFFRRAQKSQREAGYLCRSLDFPIHPGKNEKARGILGLTAGDALEIRGARRAASWAGYRADWPGLPGVPWQDERDASRFNATILSRALNLP